MLCFYCDEPLLPDEPQSSLQNGTLHRECMVRMTAGSAEHIMQLCRCYRHDGTAHDEPAGTLRDSAKRAERAMAAALVDQAAAAARSKAWLN